MYDGITILSTIVNRVIFINHYVREGSATPESILSNLRHRWGDADTIEGRATRESMISNLRHRWWDTNASEGRAT